MIDDGSFADVAGLHDPCGGYPETRPNLAVLCADARCFEYVAQSLSFGVAAERRDEHGFDLARGRDGYAELSKHSKDMARRSPTRCLDCLCARCADRVGVGGQEEGVGEEDRPGCEDAEGSRGWRQRVLGWVHLSY